MALPASRSALRAAALVLEIDVDVGRLVALGADEALEQQVDLRRVDRGDAETVADRRVGRRAAALAQDAAAAGKAHQVLDRQEIGRVAELGDQRQLVLERRRDPLGNAVRIAFAYTDPGQPHQLLLRRTFRAGHLVGVFVFQLIERERTALGDLKRTHEGVGPAAEQARHLLRAFQVPFGIGFQAEAGFLDGAMLADASNQVEQRLAPGFVHTYIVGRDQGRTAGLGQPGERNEPPGIVAAVEVLCGQVAGAGETYAQIFERMPEGLVRRLGRQHDQDLALAVGDQLGQGETARALFGAALAQGEQAAEPAIGRPVARIAEQLRAVLRHQTGAGQQLQSRLPGCHMGAHHAGQRVAVGRPDGGQAQRLGGQHQLVRVRGAPQEAVVGRDLELGVNSRGHGGSHLRYVRHQGRINRARDGLAKSLVAGHHKAFEQLGTGDIKAVIDRMIDRKADSQSLLVQQARFAKARRARSYPRGNVDRLLLRDFAAKRLLPGHIGDLGDNEIGGKEIDLAIGDLQGFFMPGFLYVPFDGDRAVDNEAHPSRP
jgi:hypothetical protein